MTKTNARDGRCLSCGLLVTHHFDARNRALTCDEARRVHPRATQVKRTLLKVLLQKARRRA